MRNPGPGLIAALPKAELHVHLEGTLEPGMLLALARRNQVPVPWSSVDELRAAYQFTGLEHFLPLLFQVAAVDVIEAGAQRADGN